MKLNLHVLYDEMLKISTRIIADEDISLDLQGVRFLPDDEEFWSTEYVYVVHAENLSHYKGATAQVSLICIGEIEDAFFQSRGWQAIILEEKIDKQKMFEKVLGIFEVYEKWNEELTRAILNKASLQTVMDIGTRYLWNPIALFDMAATLIAYAGPPLPENIAGTVWETVLERGYSPLEELSYEERATGFENLGKYHQPVFTHSAKASIKDNNFIGVGVFQNDNLFGYLAASDINKSFSLGQASLVNHLKNILELFIKNSTEYSNISENTTYFVDRILQGFPIEPSVVMYHLHKRGWKLQGDYQIYFFSSIMDELMDPEQSKHLVLRIGSLLNDAMVFPYENEIVAIIHGNIGSSDETLRHTLEKFLKDMDLRVGVSMVYPNFMDLKYAYIQSKIALKEGMAGSSGECFYEFQRYFNQNIIHSLDVVTSLKSLCHPKLLKMAMNGGKSEREVIHSLRLFLFNGRNISTTAALLYIHRNTLIYRLRRIEEILELNLKDLKEQEFLSLYLGCLIIEHFYNAKPIS